KEDGTMAASLDALYEVMKRAAALREARVAVVIDFASRIAANPQHPSADEQRYFVGCEKLCLNAAPVIPRPAAGGTQLSGAGPDAATPLFNPVVWLVNREQDLPSWFLLDSERLS